MAVRTATGNDQPLTGTDDADEIFSADYNNLTIEALEGDDDITLGLSSGTTASGGGGSDYFLEVDGSDLTLNGDQGSDFFYIFAASDSIFNGGDDADLFSAGASTNSNFNGDAGDDTFSLDVGDQNTFDGGIGDDTVVLFDEFDAYTYTTVGGITTISSDCTCYTNYVTNIEYYGFLEGTFSTVVIATESDQELDGTTDDDALSAKDFENVTLNGLAGNDLFYARASIDSIFNGGAGADRFDAQESTNGTFNGGEDNDEFLAYASIDGTFNGGAGDDTFGAETGTGTTFNGDEGDDTFYADASDGLVANGGADDDVFFGGDSTNAQLNGEAGSDYLYGEFSTGGAFSGGLGDDQLYADDSIGGTFNGNEDEDFLCACDSSGGIFNGGAGNDILEAEASFNGVFNGDEGDDSFYVEEATDASFNGGSGNDTFTTAWEGVENLGTITIDGGDDIDTATFDGSIDTFVVVKTADTVTLTKDGTTYIVTNVETFEFYGEDGTQIYTFEDIPCFIAGTLIATPCGETPVEALEAGDLVRTADGGVKPVRWVGRKTVSTVGTNPLRVYPIRLRAGALGENRPIRDLYVSPDHALMVEGLLIQAGALVNGVNIVRHLDMPTSFIYYHIEVEGHDLILADGAPAETFVNNITRMTFDNWRDCPTSKEFVEEMDFARAKSWRQVPRRIHEAILQNASRPCDLMPAAAE